MDSVVRVLLVLLVLTSCRVVRPNVHTADNNKAEGRTLTFLPTAPTRVQFIGGIGIPVEDLFFESVTSGYVLKAEYYLPTTANEFRPTYFRPQTIHRRSLDNGTLSASAPPLSTQRSSLSANATQTDTRSHHRSHRPHTNHSSSFGDNWQRKQKTAAAYRWIIYRAVEMLMDSAALPGRVCLLRSICEHAAVPLLYDSGMLAELLHIVLTPTASRDDFDKPSDGEYLAAEVLGRSGGDCERAFSGCAASPIDQISTVFDFAVDSM